jgi:hypothetical protein
VVDINDYMLLKSNYGAGCATPPVPLPVSGYTLFGFEDASLWSPIYATATLTSAPKSQGVFALTIGGNGRRQLESKTFPTSIVPPKSCRVSLDVAVPPPADCGRGGRGPQLIVSMPSARVFNESLAPIPSNSPAVNGFSTISYRLPENLRRAFARPHADVTIKIVLNGNDGILTVDNLRFSDSCDRPQNGGH